MADIDKSQRANALKAKSPRLVEPEEEELLTPQLFNAHNPIVALGGRALASASHYAPLRELPRTKATIYP